VTTFSEQIATLGRLQEVDNGIDHLKDEERQIPILIQKTKENITTAQAKLEDRKAQLKSLQDQRRSKERELEEHEGRIKSDKTKLMDVKTNQEYTAMLKEIEQIQKICDERSEDILIVLEQIERMELEVKKARVRYDEAKHKIDTEASRHEERLAQIPAELAELKSKQDDLARQVDAILLKRYTGLRKQKSGVAIVKADGGVCHGCNMSVPPQQVNKLHRNEELVFCANCQRILFWEGALRVNRVQPVVENPEAGNGQ
jgi:uncharacterized protein